MRSRNSKSRTNRNKGGVTLRDVLIRLNVLSILRYLFLFLSIVLLVYMLFVVISFVLIEYKKTSSMDSYLSEVTVMSESTLVVIESPVEDRLLGAWIVMRSSESPVLMMYYIPWWVYLYDYSGSSLSSRVSLANLEYSGNLIDPDSAKSYAVWQLIQNSGISISNYIWLDRDSVNSYINLYGDIGDFQKSDHSMKYREDVSMDFLIFHHVVNTYSVFNHFIEYKASYEFVKGIESNMPIHSLYSFLNSLKSNFKNGGMYALDVSQDAYVREVYDKELARNIPILDTNSVDMKYLSVLNMLKDRQYSSELSRVEVYNGSDISGLAFRFKRVLSNSGINVIRYDNAPDVLDTTKLYITNDKFPITKDVITNILGDDIEIIYSNPQFITTGDFVIILGKDTANKIEFK